jgi:hypothetical protein
LTICGDEADLFEFDGLDIGRVGIEELDFTFKWGESFSGFCEVGCHAPDEKQSAEGKDKNTCLHMFYLLPSEWYLMWIGI